MGLMIEDMEQDPKLEDLVLSVFHSMSLTFMGTPTMKLIENHLSNAWVRAVQINIVQAVRPPAGKPTMPLPPPGGVPTGEPSQTPSEIGPIPHLERRSLPAIYSREYASPLDEK